MSYSGRCSLSSYLTGRDANRGTCTQPCRWDYKLVEAKRPTEAFPIEEDMHGSYILNSKDLCLLEQLPQLAAAGVCAFKIEGRHKSVGYLATITRAYRRAIDDFAADRQFDRQLFHEIATTGNRGFTLGFFDGSQKDLQNFERAASENPQSFLGLVEKFDVKNSRALFAARNRFQLGDKIEVVPSAGDVFAMKVSAIWNEKMEPQKVAHGGQRERVWVNLACPVPRFTLLRKCLRQK